MMLDNRYDECVDLLNQRGVVLEDIIDCVIFVQKPFFPNMDREEILVSIKQVLYKREVQNALLTGISLDIAAEKGQIASKSLNEILLKDASLYGVDEVLAYGICNIYGSIALTNFGYIDREKPGIIGKLNDGPQGKCHTFLDDIVGAIVASVASKMAHSK